jgi:hypothetical protein
VYRAIAGMQRAILDPPAFGRAGWAPGDSDQAADAGAARVIARLRARAGTVPSSGKWRIASKTCKTTMRLAVCTMRRSMKTYEGLN